MAMKLLCRLLASATAICTLAATAHAADFVYTNKHADITKMCGTKPTRVAMIDGQGGDTWRKTSLAELRDEASKCKNITEVQYTDAGGDAQAYNSAINAYTAQGFDIIIAFTDFGDAAIPAYREATKAGVIMAPYFNNLGGEIGVDYSVNTYEDAFTEGKMFGDWVGKTVKKGNTVFLGGIPGAASSTAYFEGYKEGLKAYPNIKLLDENFIVTNWNPADAQRAVTGLIARYPKIDAIGADYGQSSLAAVKAFEQAGLAVPAMAYPGTNNEYSCKFIDQKAAGKAWKQFAVSGNTADIRFALRAALAKFQGTENNEPRAAVAYTFSDTEAGLDPLCDKNAPPDADLGSSLPREKLIELFKH
ncbi:substrate-binding domain-containing protein [Rhizobium multihospitium]|uniref:Monosaccharide ABC transporter substrate-binding protein, CUT2 family (TC 3.A.1.2.-) n=1 Tax=Rhizobium multihospitium TaxID=410764 RepID=A0A1C3X5R2_9HYPH|nr:substrate-binding domain-containing protein [Rhizobium multihospitium]SCB47456.1 monosaccharide ABC transporter substrate-binding protein, CUT2 family (TC 3.A.1.2.-) [Rhizobium multihospitium]